MKAASLIFISIFMFTAASYAHPPSDIKASYDKDKAVLGIDVTHPVHDSEKHFVYDVKILHNGNIISEKAFTSQTNNNMQSINIKSLNLKTDDEITIEAKCNIYGKLKKSTRL